MTLLRSGSATDVGRVRAVNQDAVLDSPTLFVVADGMGGHAAGEVAASTAITTLQAASEAIGTAEGLEEAIAKANRSIYNASLDDPSLAGMGTTVVAAALVGDGGRDRIVVMNVGDSRAYRFRRGTLVQVTHDHSLVAEMVRRGEIDEAEAELHPQRHVITRALGLEDVVVADSFPVHVREGDRLLLCSDGLTNELDDEEIARVLSSVADPKAAADDLVARANAHGGADNISVVVIDVLMADEGPEEATAAHAVISSTTAAAAGPRSAAGPEVAAATEDEGWVAKRRRLGIPRILTARVLLFVLLVLGLLAGAWAFLRWYAMSSYYVASKGSKIVIYQGRPGGLLWFQPKVVTVSATTIDDVLPVRQRKLAHGIVEPTLADANRYVAALAAEKAGTSTIQPSSTPKVTVTTLPPPTAPAFDPTVTTTSSPSATTTTASITPAT